MSRVDQRSAYDGISIINGGMDSGQAPVTIGRSKVAFARNVQFRRGQPATRPGWKRRPLLFADATTQLRFEESLFQGASPYSPYSGGAKLVAQIGGRTFKLDVDTNYLVSDLSLTGDLNPSTRPKSWFVQAEDFLVIQDGQSAALIYDGVTLRRVIPSSVPNEIPVGTVMEYSMGRIWVTLPNGRSFVAGDLAYSDSGTAAYNNRDAVLKFTENDFLNEGGEFGVPSDVGIITSMRAIAVLDTSLGQGPLQVMAERGIFSVDAPFDRTEWKNLERPIQTVSLMGNGARSHESAIGINGDLWFRSTDGIRSFQVARRDFGAWVNTPLSTEMAAIIDLDDRTLLQHSSAAIFDNRYLLTSSPARVPNHGIIWRGLIALDFDNVSGLTARSAPAYDGFWTGLDILQVVPLDDRLFYFVLNSASKIELWEQTRYDEFDNGGSATPTRISSYIDTPAFDFVDKGWDRKVIATADTWWRDLAGYVDFNVEWRPDDHECWTQWHSWCVDSKRTTCLDECGFPLSLRPQYRPRMRLPLPPDDCNEKANMPLRHGFHHQLRIAWTGHARLTKLRLVAHEWQEETEPFCEPCEAPESDIAGVACCDTALFAYHSLFYSVAASASCEDDQELTAIDELPAWLSVSGSTLVVEAGHFTASTQAAADALAQAYVADYLANGLESGALVCGDVPCFDPGDERPFVETWDTLPFSCADCIAGSIVPWDGYLSLMPLVENDEPWEGVGCQYRTSISPFGVDTISAYGTWEFSAILWWDAANTRWTLLFRCYDETPIGPLPDEQEHNLRLFWWGHFETAPGHSPAGVYTIDTGVPPDYPGTMPDPTSPTEYNLDCRSATPATITITMSTP